MSTTELTILPDGRIYTFGLSRQILDILASLEPRDPSFARLISQVRGLEKGARKNARPCGNDP
jgi:hypothetical protein